MKKTFIFVGLLLLFLSPFTAVHAARYTRELPPQWIELIGSPDADEWAFRITDSSDVDRLQVNQDGTIVLFNSSGTTKVTINSDGTITHEGAVYLNDEFATETYTTSGNSPYTVDGVNTVFTGSANASGATELVVTLPTITEALDGYMVTFKSIGSGVSHVVVTGCTNSSYDMISGGANVADAMEYPLGTTSAASAFVLTANSGVSAWIADYVSGSTNVWRLIHSSDSG